MIDFACKTFQLDEIIRCSFTITKADFRVMEYMVKRDEHWFTTEELAENLNLNLTTIQRAVKKLFEKQVLERKQNNLSSGGYIYIYRIKDKSQIRKLILEIIDDWKGNVERQLKSW